MIKVDEVIRLPNRSEARRVTADRTRQHLLTALLHGALHSRATAELDNLEAAA